MMYCVSQSLWSNIGRLIVLFDQEMAVSGYVIFVYLQAYILRPNAMMSLENAILDPPSYGGEVVHLRESKRKKREKNHFMYTSTKEPILRCILLGEGRGHPRTRRWRCTTSSVDPIDLLHIGHQVLSFNCQWSDWAFHLQLQPGNGFASIRSISSSSGRCNVERFFREEYAVIFCVPDEVKSRRGNVGKEMVARKHRARSKGMYGFAITLIGVGVLYGNSRGEIEGVWRVPTRYGDAGHAGGIV